MCFPSLFLQKWFQSMETSIGEEKNLCGHNIDVVLQRHVSLLMLNREINSITENTEKLRFLITLFLGNWIDKIVEHHCNSELLKCFRAKYPFYDLYHHGEPCGFVDSAPQFLINMIEEIDSHYEESVPILLKYKNMFWGNVACWFDSIGQENIASKINKLFDEIFEFLYETDTQQIDPFNKIVLFQRGLTDCSFGWGDFCVILDGRYEEFNKYLEVIWKRLFLASPEESFQKIRQEGFWEFPDIKNTINPLECGLEERDYLEFEIEMHKVPRIFEILDYFKGETQYKYNDEFKTHCCHFKNIPYFHFAMDPCELNHSDGIFEKINRNFPDFLKDRYPRFFDPDSSMRDGHKFISEGERKMAFLLRKHLMGENDGEYVDFKERTAVV